MVFNDPYILGVKSLEPSESCFIEVYQATVPSAKDNSKISMAYNTI